MELIKRGDIYWIKFDPIESSGIGKNGLGIIISNNINNEFADTVTVIPITTGVGKVYPFEVFLKAGIANLPEDSRAKTNQIRTIDKKRIKNLFGTVPDNLLREIEKAAKIHLDSK